MINYIINILLCSNYILLPIFDWGGYLLGQGSEQIVDCIMSESGMFGDKNR